MTFYGQIYKITYPNDPHYYYGQTTLSLEHRLQLHIKGAEKGLGLNISEWILSVLNTDFLQIESIGEAFDRRTLDDLERDIVGDLWKTDPDCLNMIPGGLGGASGEDHPGSVLTMEQVKYIRDLWLTKEYSRRDIASTFDVSPHTIGNIIKNRNYYDPSYNPPKNRSGQNHPLTLKGKKLGKEIRLFAQDHRDWSGAAIAEHFGLRGKQVRATLRNDRAPDPNWDPETWTYLRD